jgi:uncharacterized protein GlcG (DUF336 family)
MEPLSPTGPITAAIAMEAVTAAVRRAEEMEVRVSAAVVDSGGNLKTFLRMDGAEIAGPTLAIDKAYTAVANRIATHDLASLTQPGQPLFGLHTGAGGRYTIYGGGVPVVLKGEVVGAVGVSGAAAEQDTECATVGAEACLRGFGSGL